MNDLRDWLKDADPVAHEPPLADTDAQRMRRVMLAASARPSSLVLWDRGTLAAACVVLAVTIALGVDRWRWIAADLEREDGVDAPAADVAEGSRPRQLQLIAPGGTRVIWVFNEDFKP
jgi:hypothetical protein